MRCAGGLERRGCAVGGRGRRGLSQGDESGEKVRGGKVSSGQLCIVDIIVVGL